MWQMRNHDLLILSGHEESSNTEKRKTFKEDPLDTQGLVHEINSAVGGLLFESKAIAKFKNPRNHPGSAMLGDVFLVGDLPGSVSNLLGQDMGQDGVQVLVELKGPLRLRIWIYVFKARFKSQQALGPGFGLSVRLWETWAVLGLLSCLLDSHGIAILA